MTSAGSERYLPDTYRDRLMRDITGVHLAITEGDLAGTVPLLRAGGFLVRQHPGGVVALRGGTTAAGRCGPSARNSMVGLTT